jgi:hypothetical protein
LLAPENSESDDDKEEENECEKESDDEAEENEREKESDDEEEEEECEKRVSELLRLSEHCKNEEAGVEVSRAVNFF